jgi:hypothetical protein
MFPFVTTANFVCIPDLVTLKLIISFQAALLFHELLVHIWAAAENSRLSWIRDHQRDLRADLYCGVVDALHEGVDLASIGRKVILPATFTSGPPFHATQSSKRSWLFCASSVALISS